MKKLFIVMAVFALLSVGVAANATVSTYEFSFTAADMLFFATANGADGSTGAGNGLFNGARLRRDGANATGPLASRSYWASQNAAFTAWAGSTTDKFLEFNLWGLDGNGVKWGEDYKPTDWGATTNPAGWTPTSNTWTSNGWGTPPAGYITEEIIGWTASSYADGLNFGDGNLGTKKFTFQVDLDSTNDFWGQSTNGAPNTLPQLTFWFGGWFDNAAWFTPTDTSYYMYEGNMVLTGKEVSVPEPATMLLLGLGLMGLAGIRRKLRS